MPLHHLPLLLLLLLLAVTSAASSTPPSTVLDRRFSCDAETHRACGAQVGAAMKTLIAAELTTTLPTSRALKTVEAWAATAAGAAVVARYLAVHEAAVPDLVDEVRGLAEGSGQPFARMFLLNALPELLFEATNATYAAAHGQKSCTDVHLAHGGGPGGGPGGHTTGIQAWGHNEDGELSAKDGNFILTARIAGATHSTHYTAFAYVGRLAGWAWGWNAHGVVVSINALSAAPPVSGGVGVNFVARRVLDAHNVSEAVAFASTAGTGAAAKRGEINRWWCRK